MELGPTLSFRGPFAWDLKSCNANVCPASQLQATDCPVTRSTSGSSARFNSCVRLSQRLAGQRLTDSDWQVGTIWSEHSYSTHRILARHSAPFTFLGAAKTSVSRRRLITVHASVITSVFGH